jgi:small-conductance mechanosensitive channel
LLIARGNTMASPPSAPPATPPPSPLQEIGVNLIDNPGLWLQEVLEKLTVALKVFLPNLLGALALLVIGWLAAFIVRWLIHRFGKGLDAILAVIHRWLGQEVIRPRWSVSKLVANIAFWIILAYAVSGAAEQLGLVAFANWVLGLLGYLPRVLISVFIVFIGYLISNGVRNMVVAVTESGDFRHGLALGRLVAGLILAFTLLLALAQLGLDVAMFTNIILLAAAALFGSTALAFGIGAGDAVRNVIASHYVRKAYRPGQRIRIQELDGEILEMTQVAVIMETDNGEAWIPARHFLEDVALVIEGSDEHA